MEILREKNSIVLTSNMAALSRDRKPRIGTKSYPIQYEQQRSGTRFTKVPINFRARKAVLCLPRLHSRSKFQKF